MKFPSQLKEVYLHILINENKSSTVSTLYIQTVQIVSMYNASAMKKYIF